MFEVITFEPLYNVLSFQSTNPKSSDTFLQFDYREFFVFLWHDLEHFYSTFKIKICIKPLKKYIEFGTSKLSDK